MILMKKSNNLKIISKLIKKKGNLNIFKYYNN